MQGNNLENSERRRLDIQEHISDLLDSLKSCEKDLALASDYREIARLKQQIDTKKQQYDEYKAILDDLNREIQAKQRLLNRENTAPRIGFNISGVIDILGSRMYSSDFVFVRENLQNAVDAVRLRCHRENKPKDLFPIEISIDEAKFEIRDSGVGMTKSELLKYYWAVASSSKTNDEAKSAKCIGEFGIGGFANFGMCSSVEVTTSSINSPTSAIRSLVLKKDIANNVDNVFIEFTNEHHGTGTAIKCMADTKFNVEELTKYIIEFSKYLPETVRINNSRVKRKQFQNISPDKTVEYCKLAFGKGKNRGYVSGRLLKSEGSLHFVLDQVELGSKEYWAGGQLQIGKEPLYIFKHNFLISDYLFKGKKLGGYLDLPFLLPTANRQSFDRESQQILLSIHNEILICLADYVSQSTELIDNYWAEGYRDFVIEVKEPNRFVENLTISILEGDDISLLQALDLYSEAYIYSGGSRSWLSNVNTDIPIIDISYLDKKVSKLIDKILRENIGVRPRPSYSVLEEIGIDLLNSEERRTMLAIKKWLEGQGLDHINIRVIRISPVQQFVARCIDSKFEINIDNETTRLLVKEISESTSNERAVIIAGIYCMDFGGANLSRARKGIFSQGGIGLKAVEEHLPTKEKCSVVMVGEISTQTEQATNVTISEGSVQDGWKGEGRDKVFLRDKDGNSLGTLLRIPDELIDRSSVSSTSEVHFVAFADRFFFIAQSEERYICIRGRINQENSESKQKDSPRIIQKSQLFYECETFFLEKEDGLFANVPGPLKIPKKTEWAIIYDSFKFGSQEKKSSHYFDF